VIPIRNYTEVDEKQWRRCRVVAFLDSAYFDDVRREKPRYENPSLELIAEDEGAIVGFLDVEKEITPGSLCSERPGSRAMIWDIGVHPDYRRRGIAREFVTRARAWADTQGVEYLEAWTRDDIGVRAWYASLGFQPFFTYWHIYMNQEEAKRDLRPTQSKLSVISAFAHLIDPEAPRGYKRVHECCGFELPVRMPPVGSSGRGALSDDPRHAP